VAAVVDVVSAVGSGSVAGAASAGAASSVPARASSGCSLRVPAVAGDTTPLLKAGGENGGYVQEIPPSYDGRHPLPVVIDLHGLNEAAPLQAGLTQLGAYGAMEGFITITPESAAPVPLWVTSPRSTDMAFIGGLLQRIDTTLCIDRNRVFVTGYSNGAFMASAIGCVYADQVAAIAPVAGLTNPKGCHPSRPIPVVAFHGTADQEVAYSGGLGPLGKKLADPFGHHQSISVALGTGAPQPNGPSLPAIAAAWANRNGCNPTPQSRAVTHDTTLIAYTCANHATVELYRIAGGGHAWPGSSLTPSSTGTPGQSGLSISADQIMWQFFVAHPLRG
jgi:polyhydroxybutyrate depolymerase